MAPPPGPYSGTSTLALVARASAFTFGLFYGSVKLRVLKILLKGESLNFSSPSLLCLVKKLRKRTFTCFDEGQVT
ncbi:uncharacterized protein Pyn_14879 [Prunus yedoensis var. nudiflora]|uniref:Uncharacterized protein n=1 Tax=Prunus yedoensis var. nudiflora TaxID=2094558 RepID=A0A314ZJ86_PRUYE|nr:uncharacterized protein Pyn_14879 [Prunus yedoensis var. nudiflora]